MASIINADELGENTGYNSENNVTSHDWTFIDIQQLLRISKAALPENDILNYTTAVNLLDWNKLKFGEFTANDCKAKLLEVLNMMRCHRTLTEILSDAQNFFKFQEQRETESLPSKQISITTTQSPDRISETQNHLQLRGIEVASKEKQTEKIRGNSIQSSENDIIHEIGLSSVLKHTNWCQVVVNCGEKFTATQTQNIKTKQKTSKAITTIPEAPRNESQKIMNKIRFPLLLQYLGKKRKIKEKQTETSTEELTSEATKEPSQEEMSLEKRRCLRNRKENKSLERESVFRNARTNSKDPSPEEMNLEKRRCLRNRKENKSLESESVFKNTRNNSKQNSNNSLIEGINIESFSDARDYWGYMLFAKQNLDQLVDTKPEEMLNVIYNSWLGLEDGDRQGFIKKGLKKTYSERDNLQFYVLSKVKK